MVNTLNKIWNKFLNYLEEKEFYRVYEGALITGVCSGISKKFGIDAGLVRVLFIIATIFSFGSTILLYILLVMVMPVKPIKRQRQKPSYIDGRAWEK